MLLSLPLEEARYCISSHILCQHFNFPFNVFLSCCAYLKPGINDFFLVNVKAPDLTLQVQRLTYLKITGKHNII